MKRDIFAEAVFESISPILEKFAQEKGLQVHDREGWNHTLDSERERYLRDDENEDERILITFQPKISAGKIDYEITVSGDIILDGCWKTKYQSTPIPVQVAIKEGAFIFTTDPSILETYLQQAHTKVW